MSQIRPAPPPPSAPSIQGHDVLYVLSRRRWLIILLSLLGIGAGAAIFFLATKKFASEAELLVQYVVDTRSVMTDPGDSSVRMPGDRTGDSVINTEIAILTSRDLAKEVARKLGPTNLAPAVKPGIDPLQVATLVIADGLQAAPVPKSSMIQIRYTHTDPNLVQVVVSNLVAEYLRMHTRIHRSLDFLTDLQRESEMRRASLESVGRQLREIKASLNVTSLEETRRTASAEILRIRGEIFAAEALLAERRALSGFLTNRLAANRRPSTNQEAVSAPAPGVPEAPPSAPTVTNVVAEIPLAKLAEYRALRVQIDELTRKEQGLLVEYTELSPFVRAVQDRLANLRQIREHLESDYPDLALRYVTPARPTESTARELAGAIPNESTPLVTQEIPALEAKIRTLTSQLEQLRSEAAKLDAREEEIESLERRKQIEEKRYLDLVKSINSASIDQAMTEGRATNIRVTQEATPALLAQSKTAKLAGGAAAGGVAVALALAFALEWFLDRSIRRPGHVVEGLRLPLFQAIPRLKLPRAQLLRALPPTPGDSVGPSSPGKPTDPLTPESEAFPTTSNGEAILATHVEALRDRLVMHFETEGVVHKPKLIGVTSCGRGAGVTTVATALAASLSETGEGRVLYVDLSPKRGPSLHPFHRGAPSVPLADALEGASRDAAQVQENLYVVSLGQPGAKRVGVLPKALAALMPKMKASDFDYILFDLPAISQTSVTSKVVGLLDMTFVVLESEGTNADRAKSALALLGDTKPRMAAILNKYRRYVPESLDPDV